MPIPTTSAGSLVAESRLTSAKQWTGGRRDLLSRPDRHSELISMAEHYYASPGRSVADKTVFPENAGKHDYASLSKYYWPNPDTPDGLPWIVRDGIRNPAADDYDFPRLLEMCLAVTTLAGSAKLTGTERYAEKAGILLRRWFLDPETGMNPVPGFAQFAPGNFAASPSGLIDFHFFCELTEAVQWLEFNREWHREDREMLRLWFRRFLAWMRESELPRREEAARNNHGTWYDLLLVAVALFVGDRELAGQQLLGQSIPRLDRQIDGEGAMPFEEERTLSLTYCYFNLLGWSWLAAYAKKAFHLDLWNHRNRHGATLRAVCLRLLPAFLGKRDWPGVQIAPPPREIEYCRLFSMIAQFDDVAEINAFLANTRENPIWRLPCFMTDDDWQQPPRGSEQERAFLSGLPATSPDCIFRNEVLH